MKNQLLNKFQKYINETLGIEVKVKDYKNKKALPFYLTINYNVLETNLLGYKIVLLVNNGNEQESPAKIKKQVELTKNIICEVTVYVNSEISSHNRKRLINYKVPFIIPGNQMYLPDLMIDLREHFKSKRNKKKTLSPSAQALLVYLLNHKGISHISPGALANKLNYSNMTMTRAFDEVERLGLFSESSSKKERLVTIQKDFNEIWHLSLPFLRTPVKKYYYIKIKKKKIIKEFRIAGLTALSNFTMISSPNLNEYALSFNDYNNAIKEKMLTTVHFLEDANAKLEIWFYSPKLNDDNKIVDKYSLYLSLKNSKNERIQLALDELMKDLAW